MNSIVKAGARFFLPRVVNASKCVVPTVKSNISFIPARSRTLWHMCSSASGVNKFLKPQLTTELCHCGCNGLMHTKGEVDLVEFLKEEILAEKNSQNSKSLPKEIQGFNITVDEAELTFTKELQNETIKIHLNVNLSVDADSSSDLNEESDKSDVELRAKPEFDVDIIRKGKTLSFSCSFLHADESADPEEYGDTFSIDQVSYFEGEWNEKIYTVSGDVLDGYLYDLLMTILEEKGISNEFVEKVSDVATVYEHSKYVNLLENISKFVSVN